MIAGLIPAVASIIGKVVDRAIPDKSEATRLKIALQEQLMNLHQIELQSAAQIIQAEAGGESWLQRNWRPIVMLTFAGLIVARWLGWAAPNLSEDEYLALWEIVKIGLGGYVLGRSVEKATREWARKDASR